MCGLTRTPGDERLMTGARLTSVVEAALKAWAGPFPPNSPPPRKMAGRSSPVEPASPSDLASRSGAKGLPPSNRHRNDRDRAVAGRLLLARFFSQRRPADLAFADCRGVARFAARARQARPLARRRPRQCTTPFVYRCRYAARGSRPAAPQIDPALTISVVFLFQSRR
jgi:hypothetical protein